MKKNGFLDRLNAKKRYARMLLAGAVAAAATSNAFAAAPGGGGAGAPGFGDKSDSFGQLLGTIITWMQGNLGKLLALFGFIGTFVIYLMTHKGSVLFIGIIISLIAGGIVGIVQTFFEAGKSAFEYNAQP